MEIRKILHSESKGHNASLLNYDEAVALFKSLDWTDDYTFYNQEFGSSYLQLKTLSPNEVFDNKDIKVEILLDENIIEFAVTKVTREEAVELIHYYFEHDEIGNIDSYSTEYI
ncbi:hypothetical protein JET18_16185 [Chryseobacterium sp. L7]|uniref:Uncharacterized protein n=1 Tax=Chryseobacterium endalhagicum TaxID=2797638 RepID=A0ABS1QJ65_9FLAO|nr:hypothetical protein [Chryseobacterium endalhagicum]MBL1222392.1 hypothetical protein [Chryseobacterium endalhagicum]